MGKLIFFDIDGTLVDFTGKMSDSTKEALKKARENGHEIFLCSGRGRNLIYDFLLEFGFDGIVGATGAYVEYRQEVLYHNIIQKEALKQVLEVLEDIGAKTVLHCHTTQIASRETKDIFERRFGELMEEELNIDNAFYHMTLDDDVLNYYKTYEKAEGLLYCEAKKPLEWVQNNLPPELKVTECSFKEPDAYSGEITLAAVDKASGIQRILDKTGGKKEDVIAFGDGANDIEMLQFAGMGVAMGNAQPCAKEVADMVTEDIDRDGIAIALKKLGII